MLFRSIVTAIFAVAFSSTAVSALPSGAPKCAINSAVIAAGHKKPDDPTLGYSVSIAASGASWEITVTNSAGRKSFQGTLFYITTSLDPSKHLGKFTFDAGEYRPQTKSVCEAAKITGDPSATITHSKPSKKAVGTKFTWTPDPADLTVAGDPIFNFSFADNDGDEPSRAPARFMTGKVPFEFRPKTQPVPTAQPPAPTQPPPTTAPTTAPGGGGGGGGGVYGDQKPATTRKVIKCTPKKYSKTYSKPSTETVAPSIPEPGTGPGPAPAPGPGATPEPSSPVVLPIGGGGDGKPEPKAKGGYGKPEPKAKGGYGKPDSKAKGGYGGAPAPATKGGSY
ncbi:hypothetical protein BASA81_010505 [Batrachochytrium salamandrivorans]|nr:hypothetical protein BASA62_004335 [Batrachochytrium salamandrivorans]KAH9251597.1 hypothetical protein BASA81_010505 [Batrachochytrium salamandrivorans]